MLTHLAKGHIELQTRGSMSKIEYTRRASSLWAVMEHRPWLLLGALIWLGLAIGRIQYVWWTLKGEPTQAVQTGALGTPSNPENRDIEAENHHGMTAHLQTDAAAPRRKDLPVPPLDVLAEAPCETREVRVGLERRCLRYKEVFKDCADCPEMVVVGGGHVMEGSPTNEIGRSINEGPQHKVTIHSYFAVARYETTFDEWDSCVTAGGCEYSPSDRGWGRARHPIIGVSWLDVQQYLSWLFKRTGLRYRLLTEAEWEYAARAGTMTAFSTGDTITGDDANFDAGYTYGGGQKGEYRKRTTRVGTFKPNAFGLYDMHGNVWEWVQDCWHKDYTAAPEEGTAWQNKCSEHARVLRGGSWVDAARNLRSAFRSRNVAEYRGPTVGFRVARTLD
jgi:formylglycine-generating enzyme required for sulfatase activity